MIKLLFPPLLLLLIVLAALGTGQIALNFSQILTALFDPAAMGYTVLWHIRLPRILCAVLVSAALAGAGCTYQGMFKNPLVSPDILGVSSGAGLGAVLAIYGGFSLLGIQLAAFFGGLAAVGVVYFLSRYARRIDPLLALVLAGIAISALLGSGISLIKTLADPYSQLTTITFWLLGALNLASYEDLTFAAPLICLGLIPLFLLRWRMNVLSLNEEEARALGINTRATRLIFILAATLMTSTAVSITGIIGWIGLVIPHIARLWIGADFRKLLPTALFIGAGFLVLTDTLARSLFAIEIPLGIITAFIGAPFFLSLLIQGGVRR